MMKKLNVIFLILAIFYLFNSELFVHAEPMNVKDCLENDEDCLEEMEGPAETEESDSDLLTDMEESGPSSIVFNFIKMFFALLFVLALIYGILIILRRRKKLYQHSNLLENLGGIPLGPNKSIQIVRVGSSIYMIGVGENVEMLQEITDEQLKASLLEHKEEDTIPASNIIRSFLQPNQKNKNTDTVQSFSESLQKELNKIRRNRNNLMNEIDKKDDEHV